MLRILYLVKIKKILVLLIIIILFLYLFAQYIITKVLFFKPSKKSALIEISFYIRTDEIVDSFNFSSCKITIGDNIIELNKNDYILDNKKVAHEYGVIKIENVIIIKKEINMNILKNIYNNINEVKTTFEVEYNYTMKDIEYSYNDEYFFIHIKKLFIIDLKIFGKVIGKNNKKMV